MIPLGHRVMVERESVEDTDPTFRAAKAAGIVIADTDDKKRREAGTSRGVVLAVGSDAFKGFYYSAHGTLDGFKPWVEVGDYVAFAKYGGAVVTDNGKDYIILNDEDIFCRMEKR